MKRINIFLIMTLTIISGFSYNSFAEDCDSPESCRKACLGESEKVYEKKNAAINVFDREKKKFEDAVKAYDDAESDYDEKNNAYTNASPDQKPAAFRDLQVASGNLAKAKENRDTAKEALEKVDSFNNSTGAVGIELLRLRCEHFFSAASGSTGSQIRAVCVDDESCSQLAAECGGINFGTVTKGFQDLGQGNDSVAVNGGLKLTPNASQGLQGAGPACIKNTGYTADFKDCSRTVNIFNMLLVAEQGLATINQIQLQSTQRALANKVQNSKDIGKAAHLAQIEELEERIKLEQKNYTIYSTELTTLGGAVAAWRGPKKIHKICGHSSCCKVTASAYGNEIAANAKMRGVFVNLMAEAGLKMASLASNIKKLQDQLNYLKGIKEDLDENVAGNDLLIEYCQSQQGMTDTVKCGNSGFNPNFTTNDFNGLNDDPEWGSLNVGGTNTGDALAVFDPIGSNSGADQSSIRDGLLDFDKKAENNGYLDNPGGASFKRGDGSASGGGGGGGAGGGGGGAPSLSQKAEDRADDGSSLSKVEESGGYGSKKGGGGIYQKGSPRKAYRATASKDDKEVKNPFAGMFQNGKGESPVGPSNIALFEQISGRYGKVQEQNRIKK